MVYMANFKTIMTSIVENNYLILMFTLGSIVESWYLVNIRGKQLFSATGFSLEAMLTLEYAFFFCPSQRKSFS